jgi:hypothetical protein
MSATQTSQRGAPKANGHKSGLAAKLVKARLAVGSVEKAGRNDQQKYDYAKAEDVAVAAEKALLDQGLLADLDVTDSSETPIKSRQGSDGLIVKVVCRLIVTDPDSGEEIERGAIGYGSDYPGDKAIYKAMTGARKYALIHLLGIKLGDDPDEERKAPAGAGGEKIQQAGTAIAKKLVDRAWEIEGAKRQLRLAVSHVAGRDIGDVDTKQKATKALSALDFDQAQRVETWISKKADEEAD